MGNICNIPQESSYADSQYYYDDGDYNYRYCGYQVENIL